MSTNTPKKLIELIDSRIKASKKERVAEVVGVSEDNKVVTVSFPGAKNTYDFYNKSTEILTKGDSVYVTSNDGDLVNGYVSTRFGECTWLKVGKGIGVEDGSIGGDALEEGAVTEGKIADFSVTNAKIENLAVTNAKIENAAITNAKIENAAITNAKIANLAVDHAKIAYAAIDSANIKEAAIKSAHIDQAQITDAHIVSLTAGKIIGGTLDAGTLNVVNLNAASITVGKINGVQIGDGVIGTKHLDEMINSKIATAQETADGKNTIFYNSIPPEVGGLTPLRVGDTWFDTDDGYKFYNYDGTTWNPASFGTNALDDEAVTGAKLKDGTITGVKLIDGAITSREIYTGAIIADKLAACSVTANAINTKAINANHIDTNTITADKLLLGDSSNLSTIELFQYSLLDWDGWTGITIPTLSLDGDGFIATSSISDTDLFFSLPGFSSFLTKSTNDNALGFSFSLKNSSTSTKTVAINAYFFDYNMSLIGTTTVDVYDAPAAIPATETSPIVDVTKFTTTKLVDKMAGSMYVCFGLHVSSGFTCSIRDIQIRKANGSTFIMDGAIITDKIISGAITADKIAASSITTDKILAGSIVSESLSSDSIWGRHIKAGEITTNHVSPNFGETLFIESNEAIISSVARLDDLGNRMETAEFKLYPDKIIATVVGSETYVNAITGFDERIKAAELKITDSAIVATVRNSSGYLADLNGLDARLDSAEFKITPAQITSTVTSSTTYLNEMNAKANASDLGNLATRVSTAETKITSTAITSTVRSSSGYINDLAGKVPSSDFTGNQIVSRINQTATTIDIDASKVNITGFVTFSTAQSLANTAESNATSNASTYAANARTNAVSDVKTGLGNNNYTTIHGGNISTRTISADKIATGSITANEIATGTITANKISLTGILNGYSPGNTTGISISSNGLINMPTSAHIDFDNGTMHTHIGRISSSDLYVYNQDGAVRIIPNSYTYVYGLNATNDPYNIPLTSSTTANKVAKFQYLSGPQIEFIVGNSSTGSHYAVQITVSDRRLKTNISDSRINALSTIKKIKTREFNWIEDMKYDDCGLIAQEIEESIGSKYINKVDQGNGNFNYQMKTYEFIPLLIKGNQELQSELVEAKNEISLLKAKTDSYDQILHEMRLEIENLKNGMVA